MKWNLISGNYDLRILLLLTFGRCEPFGRKWTPLRVLSAVVRGFGLTGAATVQFNCVSVNELKDAQINPERHRDLQVRICGLSAYFVTLDRAIQDEIIDRSVTEV